MSGIIDAIFGQNATKTQKMIIFGGIAVAAWYAFK